METREFYSGAFELPLYQSEPLAKMSAAVNEIVFDELGEGDLFLVQTHNSTYSFSVTDVKKRRGILMGGGLGAITRNAGGILIGLAVGLILGILTGALTAALTVKTAGTSGGIVPSGRITRSSSGRARFFVTQASRARSNTFSFVTWKAMAVPTYAGLARR